MPQLSIKRSVQLTLVFTIAISFIIIVVDILMNSSLDKAIQKMEAINGTAFKIKDAKYHVVQIQQFLTDASATGNNEAIEEAKQHKNSLLSLAQDLKQRDTKMKSVINNIIIDVDKLYSTGLEMVAAYKESRQAGNVIMSRDNTGFDARTAKLANHLELISSQVKSALSNSKEFQITSRNNLTFAIYITIILFSILISSISALVYFRILPAIFRLNFSIKELSTGSKDLTKRLSISRKDELGDVAVSINEFYNNLEIIFKEIIINIREHLSSIDTFHKNSAVASNSMNNLHTHTDTLASAISEMALAVEDVAKNTEIAAEIANTANQHAVDGSTAVEESISITDGLSMDINSSSSQITQLVGHSEKISNILNVIKSISDQTNLLALNAAIEAARAGTAGRGFAVVADEVRSLANNTQASTAEIEYMIEEIQLVSKLVNESMHNNINKAGETVDKSKAAGEKLSKISLSVQVLADTNIQIASATEEQNAVSNQINNNIVEVSQIANFTLKLSNEVCANSEYAANKAEQINQLISQFKVSSN